jgi:plasmid stability protein
MTGYGLGSSNAIALAKPLMRLVSITRFRLRSSVHAVEHCRSTQAEIRDILEKAARPEGRIRLGSLLAAIGREAGLTTKDVEVIQRQRDQTAAEPMTFA